MARTLSARCIVFTAPGTVIAGTTEIPAPGSGELLIRAVWTCVSPGTELRCLAGQQDGAPPFPFIPGYALAGTVIETGPGTVTPLGQRVFCSGTQRTSVPRCWGGHVEFAVVAESVVVPIPEGLDLRTASAAKLAAIAYHGVRLSRPLPHERVFVVGLGPIGRLSAELHAIAGAEVIAADLSPRRREAAESSGIRTLDPGPDLVAACTGSVPGGADIVVDATGAPPVLAAAAKLLRPRPWDNADHPTARLLVQGSYATMPPLPYYEVFRTEAAILVPRDCQRRDLETVLSLMQRGRLQLDRFVTDAGDPTRAPQIYDALKHRPDEMITAAFHWSG